MGTKDKDQRREEWLGAFVFHLANLWHIKCNGSINKIVSTLFYLWAFQEMRFQKNWGKSGCKIISKSFNSRFNLEIITQKKFFISKFLDLSKKSSLFSGTNLSHPSQRTISIWTLFFQSLNFFQSKYKIKLAITKLEEKFRDIFILDHQKVGLKKSPTCFP